MPEHGHHGHGGEMTPEQQKQMIEQQLNLSRNLGQIKYKIAVMSGKGGVGKSTVAAKRRIYYRNIGCRYSRSEHTKNVRCGRSGHHD